MQTRTYGDLFKLASALIGTGGELSTSEQDQLSHFINRRFSEIFNASPSWPRYITVGDPRPIGTNQIISTQGGNVGVYGAGTAAVNGLYVRNGNSIDGNPAFTLYDTDGTTALYNLWSDSLTFGILPQTELMTHRQLSLHSFSPTSTQSTLQNQDGMYVQQIAQVKSQLLKLTIYQALVSSSAFTTLNRY